MVSGKAHFPTLQEVFSINQYPLLSNHCGDHSFNFLTPVCTTAHVGIREMHKTANTFMAAYHLDVP